MFIWDFVAAKVLGQIVDWFYSQIVGFLGNFFAEKNSTMLCTQSMVKSSAPMFPISAKKLPRKPTT